MIVYVCVGSGCHLKGSYEIINKLKTAIQEKKLEDQIELKASFCLGQCMSGVTLKVNEDIITNVNPENFQTVFENSILSLVK